MKSEIGRLARHVGPVVVTWAVAKGYVPAEVQGPLIELATVTLTMGVTLYFSKSSDKAIAKKG